MTIQCDWCNTRASGTWHTIFTPNEKFVSEQLHIEYTKYMTLCASCYRKYEQIQNGRKLND